LYSSDRLYDVVVLSTIIIMRMRGDRVVAMQSQTLIMTIGLGPIIARSQEKSPSNPSENLNLQEHQSTETHGLSMLLGGILIALVHRLPWRTCPDSARYLRIVQER
jgi:hypothetical protein